ncbi:MAG: hypothetical protein ING19_12230 [Azospirillum sp.]|nr:hypothetical protein [Azospirillum sp.]
MTAKTRALAEIGEEDIARAEMDRLSAERRNILLGMRRAGALSRFVAAAKQALGNPDPYGLAALDARLATLSARLRKPARRVNPNQSARLETEPALSPIDLTPVDEIGARSAWRPRRRNAMRPPNLPGRKPERAYLCLSTSAASRLKHLPDLERERDGGWSVPIALRDDPDFNADLASAGGAFCFASAPAIVPLRPHLIPSSSWGSSLANIAANWRDIKAPHIAARGGSCAVCGCVPVRRLPDCHEIWTYRMPEADAGGIKEPGLQTLIGLESVCEDCHEIFHLSLATARGRGEIAAVRLAALNQWNAAELEAGLDTIMRSWERRSEIDWILDLSFLGDRPVVLKSDWKATGDGWLTGGRFGSRTRIVGARVLGNDGAALPFDDASRVRKRFSHVPTGFRDMDPDRLLG